MKQRELMGGIAGLITAVSVCVQAGPFDSWSSKMKITFPGYNGTETLTNFPALVVFNQGIPDFLYSQFAATNGYELRFADSTELTELNYETEQWNIGGSSYVWVQVPQFTSNCWIWAYWGNADASVTSTPAYYTTNGATWDSNCVAVYHFNGSTSGAYDSSANHINGTLVNGVANTNGMVAGAYNFTRSQTQYINCGTSPSLDLTNNFTISVWLKRAGPSTDWERLVGKTPQWSAAGIDMYMGQNNYDLAFKAAIGPPNSIISATGLPFEANKWHPVAVTLQDGTKAMIYFDGVRSDNSGSITGALPSRLSTPLYIGAYLQSAGVPAESYNGTMDEVRFETTVRSSNWIWASYMTMASNTAFTTYGAVSSASRGGALLILR